MYTKGASVHHTSSVHPSSFSINFSETTRPIHSHDTHKGVRTKVYSNDPGLVTKMVVMTLISVYGKTHSNYSYLEPKIK